jgi:hypothetical protein
MSFATQYKRHSVPNALCRIYYYYAECLYVQGTYAECQGSLGGTVAVLALVPWAAKQPPGLFPLDTAKLPKEPREIELLSLLPTLSQ